MFVLFWVSVCVMVGVGLFVNVVGVMVKIVLIGLEVGDRFVVVVMVGVVVGVVGIVMKLVLVRLLVDFVELMLCLVMWML